MQIPSLSRTFLTTSAIVALAASVSLCAAGAETVPALAGRASAQKPDQAELYVAPSGNDAGRCKRKKPCKTLNRAYRVAKPGQVVEMAGGYYGAGQRIFYDRRKEGAKERVVFRPAKGEVPIFGAESDDALEPQGLALVGAQHITLQGIKVNGDVGLIPSPIDEEAPADDTRYVTDVLFRGGRLKTIHFHSVVNVRLTGVEMGDFSYNEGAASSVIGRGSPAFPLSRNVLIDRVRWHKITRDGSPTHPECLKVEDVDGITIRNSRFLDCPVMAIFFWPGGDAPARNVLVENNFISCGDMGSPPSECGATIDFRPDAYRFENVTVRNNSIEGLFYLEGSADSYANFRVYGNVISRTVVCFSSVDYSYNVTPKNRCGRTDRRAPVRWVDAEANDFHLKARARAINFLPARFCDEEGCPSSDIDGERRPSGKAFDAGADEVAPK